MEKNRIYRLWKYGKSYSRWISIIRIIKPYEVIISTRTISKLNHLKKEYPEIEIANDN